MTFPATVQVSIVDFACHVYGFVQSIDSSRSDTDYRPILNTGCEAMSCRGWARPPRSLFTGKPCFAHSQALGGGAVAYSLACKPPNLLQILDQHPLITITD